MGLISLNAARVYVSSTDLYPLWTRFMKPEVDEPMVFSVLLSADGIFDMVGTGAGRV